MAAGDIDYTHGILMVNEDWYGHQNSTVNHLSPDDPDGEYWHYRVIQAENPGVELGCTNQYGAIWNGRIYLIGDAIEGQYTANNLHFAAAIAFILMLILLAAMALMKRGTNKRVYGGV